MEKNNLEKLEETRVNALELKEKILDAVEDILSPKGDVVVYGKQDKEILEVIETEDTPVEKAYTAQELYIAICYLKKQLEYSIEQSWGSDALKKYQTSFLLVDTVNVKGTC